MEASERLKERIEKIVGKSGYLVNMELKGSSGSYFLKVVADTDSGISIKQISEISRAILDDLEIAKVLNGDFKLEVTSPGPDFHLTESRHFLKHVGRELEVHHSLQDMQNPLYGKLEKVRDNSIEVQVKKNRIVIPWEKLRYAKVIINF